MKNTEESLVIASIPAGEGISRNVLGWGEKSFSTLQRDKFYSKHHLKYSKTTVNTKAWAGTITRSRFVKAIFFSSRFYREKKRNIHNRMGDIPQARPIYLREWSICPGASRFPPDDSPYRENAFGREWLDSKNKDLLFNQSTPKKVFPVSYNTNSEIWQNFFFIFKFFCGEKHLTAVVLRAGSRKQETIVKLLSVRV